MIHILPRLKDMFQHLRCKIVSVYIFLSSISYLFGEIKFYFHRAPPGTEWRLIFYLKLCVLGCLWMNTWKSKTRIYVVFCLKQSFQLLTVRDVFFSFFSMSTLAFLHSPSCQWSYIFSLLDQVLLHLEYNE